MTIRVLVNHEGVSKCLFVGKDIYVRYRLDELHHLYIQFGDKKDQCEVIMDPTLGKNTVLIPDIICDISIPTMVPFECMINIDTFIIGPVIGIMGCKHSRNLTEKVLAYLKIRLKDYDRIKGLVFIFAEDGVDPILKQIRGFFYNSQIGDWQAGTFPLPSAIMVSKISMSSKLYRFFINKIGNNVYYNKHLSKWYQWKKLSKHDSLSNYLPPTEKLNSGANFLDMIEKYKKIYLKPSNSYQGKGIITVEKKDKYYIVTNIHGHALTFHEDQNLLKYLKSKAKFKYLIQKSVVFPYKNCLIDFRVYLQKNRNKEWTSPGIMARIGKESSIITNVRNRKEVIPSYYAFARYYHLKNNRIITLEKKIISICKQIAEFMESLGNHLGDLAFDIVVDKDLNIWILEFQSGYGSEFREKNMPVEMYKQLMITPLEYAKTLAGF